MRCVGCYIQALPQESFALLIHSARPAHFSERTREMANRFTVTIAPRERNLRQKIRIVRIPAVSSRHVRGRVAPSQLCPCAACVCPFSNPVIRNARPFQQRRASDPGPRSARSRKLGEEFTQSGTWV